MVDCISHYCVVSHLFKLVIRIVDLHSNVLILFVFINDRCVVGDNEIGKGYEIRVVEVVLLLDGDVVVRDCVERFVVYVGNITMGN